MAAADWTFDGCIICGLKLVPGGCEHTAAERKKAEEDSAWESDDWEDPSSERIRRENENYDKQRGGYHRIFKED